MTTTGFLHPGAMGSTVAAACNGECLWASRGRSDTTGSRADAAGLVDVGSLPALVERCDAIVSVCPPAHAVEVATSVAELGFEGVYLDANAISPANATRIAALFEHGVDGGIVGPPARASGTTRMYLSGAGAPELAGRWQGSILDVRAIDGGIGAASALKMAFAGWTKGTAALLLAVNACADSFGVADALRSEWEISLPDLAARSDASAGRTAPKAWRFEGEMHEIAETFAAAGQPPGFHLAAAEVYRRLAEFKEADVAPDLASVVSALHRADHLP